VLGREISFSKELFVFFFDEKMLLASTLSVQEQQQVRNEQDSGIKMSIQLHSTACFLLRGTDLL
jgi:hypothetical protein